MTINSARLAAGRQEHPDADAAFGKAAVSILAKIDDLSTRLLEHAGAIDWLKLEMKSRDLEILRLETDNGFMATRLKLIQTELKLAKDELELWKKIGNNTANTPNTDKF